MTMIVTLIGFSIMLHIVAYYGWGISYSQAREISSWEMSIEDIFSEANELVNANSVNNLWEEWSDLCFVYGMWANQRLGLRLPIPFGRPCWEKGIARQKIWREIFTQHNLTFSPRYLRGGSNYKKPEKVFRALAEARADQGR